MPRNHKCKAKGCNHTVDRTYSSTTQVCSVSCAVAWGREKEAKKADKEHRARKKDFYANDLKTRVKYAKQACHAYIRLRDKDLKCICCDRPLGKNYDAGHFLESGNNPGLRFDEDNIHAQAVYCNQYQGGNSGDYEGNLRKKIGDERVDRLKSLKGGTMKRTAQDYKAIEDHYKAKIKELEND